MYFGNPAIALLIAGVISIILDRPVIPGAQKLGKLSLQAAIVLLGFGMDVSRMAELSAAYALVVGIFVVSTLSIGLLLGRMLRAERKFSTLIASGTAICGGTTIVSLSPVIRASSTQTATALTIVFLLNAVALFTFPWIGNYLGMSQEAFGLWVSMAIHDTSSVVATAAIYGEVAAETATTLKLGRTLWLIPVILLFALLDGQREAKLRIPVFIVFFVLASLIGSLLPVPVMASDLANRISKALLVAALYFVGMDMTRETLRGISTRLLLQPVLLWVLVVVATLGLSLWHV